MKKIITWLLIVLVIFNFICCNNCVYAEGDTDQSSSPYREPANPSNTALVEIIEEGTVSQTQDSATKTTLSLGSFGVSAVGMVTGVVARIINVFIIQIDVLMGVLTATEEDGDDTQFWFTIDRVVFNRIALFNINYFDTESTYNVGNTTITANASNIEIKEGITSVYFICRLLALILSLLVLIYIGIRMALSTVASDQAKYKKMLVSWVESIVVMFLMVYIISAVISFGEAITGVFYNIRNDLINSGNGYDVFEDTIRATTWDKVFSFSGLSLTFWSIIYWVLLFMEIKFFWLYAKRLLMVGLLIIVSPLITITYSIDKVGDGKAQVFSSWMKEFIVNILIQPLHALIYLIFVLSANAIAAESPLVALAMLMSMGTVERMVKVVFDMKGLTTLRGVNKFMKKEG